MLKFLRVSPPALLALATLGLAACATVPTAQRPAALPPGPAAQALAAAERPDVPWLYVTSDLPHDPQWKFGMLSNGLRYAVRRNGVPPGQVSVRVRIDAGSLMEKDSERGYAHLLEHLTFRGSKYVPDGESIRTWQRYGVTFGSDSNASTTFTQTVYQLDLPDADADPTALDDSMKILSGMMEAPTLTQQAIDAERPVVIAEGREQPGPQVRLDDATLQLMFAGQPLAERKPIGTTEALRAATSASVTAFHERWYRPERAVVVAVGDVDPAQLEALIVKHFSAWQGAGPNPRAPDFGTPVADEAIAASLVEPQLPAMVTMAVVRPWTVFADTIAFNQNRWVDLIATRLINRRLESRARAGASYLAAGASLDDISRSANVTSVQVRPLDTDWDTALRDVRGVLADAIATPPTQAEIDREVAEIETGYKDLVATAPVEAGSKIADQLVEAVDINETVASPQDSYDIFRAAVDKGMFNPRSVQAASKRLFEGVAVRALVSTPEPDADAVAKLTAALKAKVDGGERRAAVGPIGFDALPDLGSPGTVVARTTVLASPQIEKVTFSNGVNLLVHQNTSEVSKTYVTVRFGRGLNGLPADRATPAWAAPFALVESGVGDLGQEELDALIGQRQIEFKFAVDDDAFEFTGRTTRADLADQLKLFAAKLVAPRWDANPVKRARAVMLTNYAGLSASPDAVLGRDLDALLHDGDPRWGTPSKEAIDALTPEGFRDFWAPQLASGPIEVEIFGDIDKEAAIRAAAATFGALPPRPAANTPPPPVRFPEHVAKPVVRTHDGQPDQAAAVIAWPTGGGSANIRESRKLDVLAAVFRDRLLERLRSQAGVSYSPNVLSQWPVGLPSGGSILAVALLPPDRTDFFFQLTREIAADLVANPIGADELKRALVPVTQMTVRQSSGNQFWMRLAEGGTTDPRRITAMDTIGQDLVSTTPAEIQALAAKYLLPERDWSMVVVPKGE